MPDERTNSDGTPEKVSRYSQSGQKTAENLGRIFGPEMEWTSELVSQGAGTTAANVAKVENLATSSNGQAKQEDKK